MVEDYLLGVDVGTSETKGVLVSASSGQVVAHASRGHATSCPRPGYFEHDPDAVWWGDFCAVVCELLCQARGRPKPFRIAAVGCSGLGADMLPVDQAGKPLRPAILYGIDTRAVQQQEELSARLRAAGRGEVQLGTGSIGPKILWFKEHEPEAYSRTRMVATASTYLTYKLTGTWTLDAYTASAFTPMVDLESLQWDESSCAGIVDPSMLPEIRWTTEVAGAVTAKASHETGLAAGTPVIVGTCDAAAEAVSVGVAQVGDLMIMYGTTAFFVGCSERPVTGAGVSAMPYVSPGLHAYAAGTSAAGASTKWFRDNLAPDIVSRHAGDPNGAYGDLAALAGQVPAGSCGLVFLPYLSGERSPVNDADACGLLFGLNLCHDRRHVYRSVLEGVAYSIRHCLEAIREAGGNPARVVAVGGGCRNPLWLQIVSDATGISQEVPAQTVGAAYGDAFMAGIGVGLFSTIGEITSRWIRVARIVTPDSGNKLLYDRLYSVYRDLYARTREYMGEMALLRR